MILIWIEIFVIELFINLLIKFAGFKYKKNKSFFFFFSLEREFRTPNKIFKNMSNKNLKNDSSASLNEDDEKADGYEVKESKVFGAAMLLPVKDHLQKLEVLYGYGLWIYVC